MALRGLPIVEAEIISSDGLGNDIRLARGGEASDRPSGTSSASAAEAGARFANEAAQDDNPAYAQSKFV